MPVCLPLDPFKQTGIPRPSEYVSNEANRAGVHRYQVLNVKSDLYLIWNLYFQKILTNVELSDFVFIFKSLLIPVTWFFLPPLNTNTNTHTTHNTHTYTKRNSLTPPGVDFTNILHAAFTSADSKSAKKDSQLKQLFAILGSAGVKAARKHVDEIDPCMK